MSLPIGFYGLSIGLLILISLGTATWLLLRARDVVRTVDSVVDDSGLEPGQANRRPASKSTVRAILWVHVLSTIAALGLVVLIATGAIDWRDTATDPLAQRP